MTKTASQSESAAAPPLPCPAIRLVAQRSPMLLAGALVMRDRPGNCSLVTATVPNSGIFLGPDGAVLPEYFIELMAQGMAAVNGYDALTDGEPATRGFLVGIDSFSWSGAAHADEELSVEIIKTFEFGPVTVMGGRVVNAHGELLAAGEIKAWEQG